MATIASGAMQVVSPDFLLSAAYVAAGFVAAGIVTDFARSNVLDMEVPGGDAMYAVGGAAATLAVSSMVSLGSLGRMAAVGMAANGVVQLARQGGLV